MSQPDIITKLAEGFALPRAVVEMIAISEGHGWTLSADPTEDGIEVPLIRAKQWLDSMNMTFKPGV